MLFSEGMWGEGAAGYWSSTKEVEKEWGPNGISSQWRKDWVI